jgi:ribose-phosphate pyrophosphokinase
MELLIMIDAFKRASAGRITAVVPYYAYGRSDKKDQPRVPITARLVANLIETAGADRVLTVDLHAGQIQGFFNIPVDELTALYNITGYLKRKRLENLVVVATDVGGSKRARNLLKPRRPLATIGSAASAEERPVVNVTGEAKGPHMDNESTHAAVNSAQAWSRVTSLLACSRHSIGAIGRFRPAISRSWW